MRVKLDVKTGSIRHNVRRRARAVRRAAKRTRAKLPSPSWR